MRQKKTRYVHRSAITGRFITTKEALRCKKTTLKQRVRLGEQSMPIKSNCRLAD